LLSVDLPWLTGGHCPPWQRPILRCFPRGRQIVTLLRSDSRDARTVAAVRAHFTSQEVDFLFIDGDHSYNGVRADFENFAPLVRPGGLVALHDIAPGPESCVGEVPRFWQEVRTSYRHQEIIDDDGQQGCGLGLLWM
jgi:predicted O-methyltransferase YrrM